MKVQSVIKPGIAELSLYAIKPVKKGEELTFSYVGDISDEMRPFQLQTYGFKCQCKICSKAW
jgi:SET domain-containing protein